MNQKQWKPKGRQSRGVPHRVLSCLHRISPKSALIFPALALASCSTQPPPPQTETQLVTTVLQLLATGSHGVCVDNATSGHPLQVFWSTAHNRPAGMEPPAWFEPAPLRPTPALSDRELLQTIKSDPAIHINQPVNATATLPPARQAELNRAAWMLATQSDGQPIEDLAGLKVPGVSARWWLRNRLSTHCAPNYRLSNPVYSNNIGFITVVADHWATTYALTPDRQTWVVSGQWSNWIY